MNWTDENLDETARKLVAARLDGAARDSFAGNEVPPDLDTAYAIQSRAVRIWNDQLVGFKVGGIPPKFRGQYPAEWLAGPVFAKNVFHIKPDQTLDFPVYKDGFAAFEPELILEVRSDACQAHQDWKAEFTRETIKRVFLGAEIAASPNINVNVLGPGSIISDFGNNAGITIGHEIKISELDKALSVMTETRIDGAVINRCRPNAAPAGPLGALAFLFNHLRENADLYDLSETIYVSSGAITGVHESHVGAVGELDYEGFETQTIRLIDGAATHAAS